MNAISCSAPITSLNLDLCFSNRSFCIIGCSLHFLIRATDLREQLRRELGGDRLGIGRSLDLIVQLERAALQIEIAALQLELAPTLLGIVGGWRPFPVGRGPVAGAWFLGKGDLGNVISGGSPFGR